ncbi:MAG: hypothetical protein ACK5Z1_01710 [Gemmatimonadota bacterium]
MTGDDRNAQGLQIAHAGDARVAARDADPPSVEKLCERAHPRPGDSNEMHRSNIVAVEKRHTHFVRIAPTLTALTMTVM